LVYCGAGEILNAPFADKDRLNKAPLKLLPPRVIQTQHIFIWRKQVVAWNAFEKCSDSYPKSSFNKYVLEKKQNHNL